MSELVQKLQAEVEQMTRDGEAIQCVVLNPEDFRSMTGFDPTFVSDFGSFLGIPIRLGDVTHVRPTLHFRLLRKKKAGHGDAATDREL